MIEAVTVPAMEEAEDPAIPGPAPPFPLLARTEFLIPTVWSTRYDHYRYSSRYKADGLN